MSIGSDLVTYLRTKAAITTLVGSSTGARILQQDGMKESGTRPAMCVVLGSDESVGYTGGDSGLWRADFTLQAFADSPTSRDSLCTAIVGALPADSSVTTMGTTAVTEISRLAGRSDGDIPATDGSDARIYFATFQYRIWYLS